MSLTAARQVADAVLYEGYLLYPYRASSSKNQVRWQFGVLGPHGVEAAGVGEQPSLAAELLAEPAGAPRLHVHLRFLQVQAREVERWTGSGWEPVAELTVGGTRWIPFHEAVPQEITLEGLHLAAHEERVAVPGGHEVEELHADGQLVGRLVRTRWPLQASVSVTTRPGLDPRLVVVGIHVENETAWSPGSVAGWQDRDVAARASFVGTHLLVTITGARFVSLLDGPTWTAADAASCHRDRCWAGLIADDAGHDAVLVSPIVLGDHPSIAPESAGDLFDATEIDEILTLRVMTMTDGEKADARGTDPRAAAIVDRCDAISDADLSRLHGARRDDLGHDTAAPETDAVTIDGVVVAKGSRVLLRPSRRADAQDIFLAGLTAIVERVYFDLDGATHLAVSLEDDPGIDLYAATGRFYYFAPDEVEPLHAKEDAR